MRDLARISNAMILARITFALQSLFHTLMLFHSAALLIRSVMTSITQELWIGVLEGQLLINDVFLEVLLVQFPINLW